MLSKCLNFALLPFSLEYSEDLVDFELFFRDTRSLETSHLGRELLKSRLKNLAFSSFKNYNSSRRPNNLTHDEFKSLLKVSKNKNVVIQKYVTGNSAVLIDKIVYTNSNKKLLGNPGQVEKLSIHQDKELNFILNCEQNVIDIVREIKNKNQILCNKLRPVSKQPVVLYDLVKIHEKVTVAFLTFPPDFSAIATPTQIR